MPVFQNTRFCEYRGREGFWARIPLLLPNSLSCVVLGGIRLVTSAAELSVCLAVKGNDGLQPNFPWTPPDVYLSIEDRLHYLLTNPGEEHSEKQMT